MCKSKNSHKMVSWIDKKDTKLYKMHVFCVILEKQI